MALLDFITGEVIGLTPGARVISPAPNYPNGSDYYTLGIEGTPPPNSAMDFNSLQLKVAQMPNGSQVITFLSINIPPNAKPGDPIYDYFAFQLVDAASGAVLVGCIPNVPPYIVSGGSGSVASARLSYGWNQDDGAYAVSGKILALDYFQPNADGRDARIFRLQYNSLHPTAQPPASMLTDINNQQAVWKGTKGPLTFARHINGTINVLWSDGSASKTDPAYINPAASTLVPFTDHVPPKTTAYSNFVYRWSGQKQ